jgi:hypothetical protein
MYGKPAMTCFKYQVYLMVQKPSPVWVLYFEWLQAIFMSHQTATHPPLQAALPPCVWQHNLHPFEREL